MPRIVCPNCAARYEVSAEVLGPAGKRVRCVRCGHVWLAWAESASEPASRVEPAPWPEPPGPRVRDPGEEPKTEGTHVGAPEIPSFPAPSPPPVPDRVRQEGRLRTDGAGPPSDARRGSGALLAAWAMSVAVLAAAAWGAIAYRSAVIAAWPASARLYALFGLDG